MKITWSFLALVVGTTSLVGGFADEPDHAQIRRWLEQNRIQPLESILARYPQERYGKLLDLEVESEDGRIIYELEFLRPDGRVHEIEVDAFDGRLLKQEIEE
jgi:uncharacterized membrane protein YkoI